MVRDAEAATRPQRPNLFCSDSNADKQEGPTEDTPQQQPAQDAKAPAQEKQGPAAQTLNGTVIKLGNKYVLKTTDKQTYELDDQDRARNMRASR